MPALKLSLKARALRYLSLREHSRLELGRKLAKYAEEGDDIEALLDNLEAAKFLSEDRFSESLVHRRASRFGNNRILSELQSHGIEGEAFQSIKSSLAEDEVLRALQVLGKRFVYAPEDAAERAKQMRFLQQRGFSHGAIQAAIRQMPVREEDVG
jgi:regulatory protein